MIITWSSTRSTSTTTEPRYPRRGSPTPSSREGTRFARPAANRATRPGRVEALKCSGFGAAGAGPSRLAHRQDTVFAGRPRSIDCGDQGRRRRAHLPTLAARPGRGAGRTPARRARDRRIPRTAPSTSRTTLPGLVSTGRAFRVLPATPSPSTAASPTSIVRRPLS